jgi:3-dehydroquinate synthase
VVTVRVPLVEQRDASYDILIAPGLVRDMGTLLARYCPAAAYAVISDSHVGKLYGEQLVAALHAAKLHAELFSFPAGEWNKTRETWATLSDRLLAAHFGRDCAVIALGGGVVGDVAGFVAATYLRGVPLVHVPTSLLAMIDSSIGGKTGVDVSAGKNLLGAFHQPRLVIADLDLLGSLATVQVAAGLAEAVKHGVIADAEYFEFLERDHAAILAKQGAALERVVRRSVEIKASVVAQDEAVAIGMVYEARLGESLGIAAAGTTQRITTLLERFRLPTALPDGSRMDALIEAMRADKKARAGAIRLVLPAAIGRMHGNASHGWTVAVEEGALRGLFSPQRA